MLRGGDEPVVVGAVRVQPLVEQAGEVLLGLGEGGDTLYSTKSQASDFTFSCAFLARDCRYTCDRGMYSEWGQGYRSRSRLRRREAWI